MNTLIRNDADCGTAALAAGFAPPRQHPLGQEHHVAAFAELIAVTALVACTLAVATVISFGGA